MSKATTDFLLAIVPIALLMIVIEVIFWRLTRSGQHSPDLYCTENLLEVTPGETRHPKVGKTAISGEGM